MGELRELRGEKQAQGRAPRRVLVTGAQGFLGRTLSARWLAAEPGLTLLGLGRSARHERFGHPALRCGRPVPAPLPEALAVPLSSPRYAYAPIDVLDRAALLRVFADFRPDVVVHLAARLKDDDPADMVRVNIEGTVNVLHAAAGAPTRPRVILGSSGAIYGRPTALPLAEDTPFGPCQGLYAVTRRASEEAALHLASASGVELIVARLFNPVGPGLDPRHLPARVAAELADVARAPAGDEPHTLRLGPLDGTRDFIDARDAVDALRFLALRGTPGLAYNVGSGRETAVGAVVEGLVLASGLPRDRLRIEAGPRGQNDVPRHVADTARLTALGFRPRYTLQETLADLYAHHAALPAPGDAPAPAAPASLRVVVAPRFEYPVEIGAGLLASVPARLRAQLGTARAVVLSDPTVAGLYGGRLLDGLRGADFQAALVTLPEGESAKCRDVWADVSERLHALGFERRSALVCLGGALVSDVGGFVAATYMRGVPYVNVPTTLLAQHDGAVGGKVAVNTPWAKNAVGAFHHPSAVFCDPETLRTLDDRNLAGGVAEAVKVALTGDAALFALLEDGAEALMGRRDAAALERVVRRSVARKIALLAPDPLEIDLRRALNLGHTLAHALETELQYAGLLHGEAVGIGLAVSTEVARARGRLSDGAADRILALLRAYGLPPTVPPARVRAALSRVEEIRRVRGGHLNFVYPTAIDAVEIVPELRPGELAAAVEAVLALPADGRTAVAA